MTDATNAVVLACLFSDDEAAAAGLLRLVDLGIAPGAIRIGAAPPGRADKLSAPIGARPDLDPNDPLAGVLGLIGGEQSSFGIDRGSALGALAGAAFGFVLGLSPAGGVAGLPPSLAPFGDALFFLVIGGVVGAVLGGALGPQRSTHAGFRLVDGIEEGRVAVVADVPIAVADELVSKLRSWGATDILRFPPPKR